MINAVLLYGEPKLTKDIDITLGVGPEYLEKLLLISKELRLKVLVNDVQEFVNQTFVLPVLEVKSGFRVDFIFSVSIYEKTALKRVSYVTQFEKLMSIVSWVACRTGTAPR